MIQNNIGQVTKLVKEIFCLGTTSVLEEVILKKRIEDSPSEASALAERLPGLEMINQYLDCVLGQVQQALEEGQGLPKVYDILSNAVDEVKHFRKDYPVNLRDLVQYSVSILESQYNR